MRREERFSGADATPASVSGDPGLRPHRHDSLSATEASCHPISGHRDTLPILSEGGDFFTWDSRRLGFFPPFGDSKTEKRGTPLFSSGRGLNPPSFGRTDYGVPNPSRRGNLGRGSPTPTPLFAIPSCPSWSQRGVVCLRRYHLPAPHPSASRPLPLFSRSGRGLHSSAPGTGGGYRRRRHRDSEVPHPSGAA